MGASVSMCASVCVVQRHICVCLSMSMSLSLCVCERGAFRSMYPTCRRQKLMLVCLLLLFTLFLQTEYLLLSLGLAVLARPAGCWDPGTPCLHTPPFCVWLQVSIATPSFYMGSQVPELAQQGLYHQSSPQLYTHQSVWCSLTLNPPKLYLLNNVLGLCP